MKKTYINPMMNVVEVESKTALLAGSTFDVNYLETLDNDNALSPELFVLEELNY